MTNELSDDAFLHLLDEATEQLRQSLNKVVAEKQLPPQVVLSALARVAAGYTHQYQRTLDDQRLKDKVEDVFIENYNLFLYDFDQYDVKEEIERIRKMDIN